MKSIVTGVATALWGLLAACGAVEQQQPSDVQHKEQSADPSLTVPEAQAIFDYAYPLVIMKISQDLMLTAPLRPQTSPNHFIHFKLFTVIVHSRCYNVSNSKTN